MNVIQPLFLGVIALGTSAVAVKSFLPTPIVQAASSQWEYMQLEVPATFQSELDEEWARNENAYMRALTDKSQKHYTFNMPQLTALGREGWELVSAVPASETTHPNFGNSGYVTGLQPNMRPGSVTLLFKRFWTQPTKTP